MAHQQPHSGSKTHTSRRTLGLVAVTLTSGVVITLGALGALGALSKPGGYDNSNTTNDPLIETRRLANGMEIVVIPDKRSDVVTHMLWYRAGSADEPAGKSGIAHFFEHLMFRGTKNMQPGEFSKTVARLGGQDNAFTSYDYTAYYQRIVRDKLPEMMRMEADRMQNLVINPEIVAIERDVILEERSLRVDTHPSSLLGEKMRSRLHENLPYGVPVIGWRDDITGLNAADARQFYARFYAPDNAILVVAGNITLAELLPLAETYYGPLKPSGQPRLARQRADALGVRDAEKPEVFADPRVRQKSWYRLYRLPVYHKRERRKFAALDVAAEILGGGATARLYHELVVTRQFATDTTAYTDTSRLDNGEFTLNVTLVPKANFTVIGSLVDMEINRLAEDGPSKAEMRRAKIQLVSQLMFSRDSQNTMAQIFGQAASLGYTPREVLDWPRQVEKVTARDVSQAVRDMLKPAHSVTGWLKPRESHIKSQ